MWRQLELVCVSALLAMAAMKLVSNSLYATLGCMNGSQNVHVGCAVADQVFCVRCPALLQIARGCHKLSNLLHALTSGGLVSSTVLAAVRFQGSFALQTCSRVSFWTARELLVSV
jgi:hypothetical protein